MSAEQNLTSYTASKAKLAGTLPAGSYQTGRAEEIALIGFHTTVSILPLVPSINQKPLKRSESWASSLVSRPLHGLLDYLARLGLVTPTLDVNPFSGFEIFVMRKKMGDALQEQLGQVRVIFDLIV
jgi:hypothetical protein